MNNLGVQEAGQASVRTAYGGMEDAFFVFMTFFLYGDETNWFIVMYY
ncbi:hypothetical protein [Paenibacillus senegalimassiliensis]|nr:hypothetical protein [Paenibacillus senegalimassiliensis]